MTERDLWDYRKEHGILPVFKRVDTCAAEFESYTPYLYSTYEAEDEAAQRGLGRPAGMRPSCDPGHDRTAGIGHSVQLR